MLFTNLQPRTQPIVADRVRDKDITSQALDDLLCFTPLSLEPMEPKSFAFYNSYVDPAHTGDFTLNISGPQTISHLQAGDPYTPTAALIKSLALPEPSRAVDCSASIDTVSFQILPPRQCVPVSSAYSSAEVIQQDTDREIMNKDGPSVGSDASEERMDTRVIKMKGVTANTIRFTPVSPLLVNAFRFYSSLNAPTAMIKHTNDIPITYLNRGQTYSLTVVDKSPSVPILDGMKYRTFVRVSFEDEVQRSQPNIYWRLCKRTRGNSEVCQREAELKAVELLSFSEPSNSGDQRTQIEVESTFFDGFCITWTPDTGGPAEVVIKLRFNFLSTDFSHCKGVRGVPVRLCAKTSIISADSSYNFQEVCFCKIKLFRDHGAERKAFNDITGIKKSINKVKQQTKQAEMIASKAAFSNAISSSKIGKRRRICSMASTSSTTDGIEDFRLKLQTLLDMLSSTLPVSILSLRGEADDDPDLYPLSMLEDASPLDRGREGLWANIDRNSICSSVSLPFPSSLSLTSPSPELENSNKCLYSGNTACEPGTLTDWSEAFNVNLSHRPAYCRRHRPIACFYIRHEGEAVADKRVHHAVYLMQRTLADFNRQIAAKWEIDLSRIQHTTFVTDSGLEVKLDDDVVRELKEGQHMRLEIAIIPKMEAHILREQKLIDTDATERQDTARGDLILRLTF